MPKNDLLDDIIKIGLILGSIWLGSEIIKELSKKDKEDNNVAGTQPPNY